MNRTTRHRTRVSAAALSACALGVLLGGCIDIDALRDRVSCEPGTLACDGLAGQGGGDAGSAGRRGESAVGALCAPDPCADLPGQVCDPRSGRCICDHVCEVLEETRCADGSLRACRQDAQGCRRWETLLECPGGCGDEVSCAGCDNACPRPGAGVCEGDKLRLCSADAQGCLGFGVLISCNDDLDCTADRCDAERGACENIPDHGLCTNNADNACVSDYCDAELGCAAEPVEAECDDSDPCTLDDRCVGGACVGDLDPGREDCDDQCPDDPYKIEPGLCGCGVPESSADLDGDGIINCQDACPNERCDAVGVRCQSGVLYECSVDAAGCFVETPRTCPGSFCMNDTTCGRTDTYRWPGAGDTLSPRALALDSANNVFVVSDAFGGIDGNSWGGGYGDAALSKWSSDGTYLWTTQWGGGATERVADVAVAGDRVAVVGDIDDTTLWLGVWSGDGAGPPLWTASVMVESAGVYPSGVVFGPQGAVYVAASTGGAVEGQTAFGMLDAVLLRFDADSGDLVWARQWGGAQWDSTQGLATDGTALYVAGQRDYDNDSTSNAFLTKFRADGAQEWEVTWSFGELNEANAVAVDPAGDIVVGGRAWPEGGLLAKLSPSGMERWSNSDLGPEFAIDSAGKIYVARGSGIDVHDPDGTSSGYISAGSGVGKVAVRGGAPDPVVVYSVGAAVGGGFLLISQAE